MWVVRERITFGGGWGHPLKWQRETGKGEARQRAKKDARRTRNFLDQWEGREKIVGKSKKGERDDWLGVKSEGRMTGEEKGRMTLGDKVGIWFGKGGEGPWEGRTQRVDSREERGDWGRWNCGRENR